MVKVREYESEKAVQDEAIIHMQAHHVGVAPKLFDH